MTIAALAMVEAVDGASWCVLVESERVEGRGRTHHDDIVVDVVAERDVTRDGHEDVNKAREADAGHHNACRAEGRVVANLVQDREHLFLLARAI
jgi:hypothetical protein